MCTFIFFSLWKDLESLFYSWYSANSHWHMPWARFLLFHSRVIYGPFYSWENYLQSKKVLYHYWNIFTLILSILSFRKCGELDVKPPKIIYFLSFFMFHISSYFQWFHQCNFWTLLLNYSIVLFSCIKCFILQSLCCVINTITFLSEHVNRAYIF